jgi:GcrA cell cycle regulator
MVNWTDKRLARLRLLHREGFSASVIARKLGPAFSKTIVLRKLRVLEEARLEAARLRTARKKAKERQLQREATKAALPVSTRRKAAPPPSKPAKSASSSRPLEIIRIPSSTPLLKPLTGIRLFDLRETHCRWPLGDESPARFFCGAPTAGTTSEHHQRVVFSGLARPVSRPRGTSSVTASPWRTPLR